MENIELATETKSLHERLENLTLEIEKKEINSPKEIPVKSTKEIPHPKNRITDEELLVKKNRVILNVEDVNWAYMLDSNSMDPLLDEGTTILLLMPDTAEDISAGDIIFFRSNLTEYNIVHRVISQSSDQEGLYYVTMGDNNPNLDPLKVRFRDIIGVVIGIIY